MCVLRHLCGRSRALDRPHKRRRGVYIRDARFGSGSLSHHQRHSHIYTAIYLETHSTPFNLRISIQTHSPWVTAAVLRLVPATAALPAAATTALYVPVYGSTSELS